MIDWSGLYTETLGDFTLAALPPTLKLPALPHAVTLYAQKSSDPDASLKELVRIVETDTGLTVELLKYVNSSFVGLRHKAKSVQQALSLLGQRQSRTYIIAMGMQAAIQARKSKLIHQTSFWNASLQKALFAREVAELLKTDADIAFAGALLQDYLLPVLTNKLFDDYLEFVETRADQPECLGQYEQAMFGWDHALAGACLAHRWNLPDDLACCILFHHQGLRILAHPELGRSPVAAVALSALLPDQLRQHYHGLEQLLKLQDKWTAFNLENIVQTVDAKHADSGLGVHNDFPLTRRCRTALESATQNT